MEINKEDYIIDSLAAGYKIESIDSNNIEFAGFKEGRTFIQFRSGATYFYKDLPKEAVLSGKFRKYKADIVLSRKAVVPIDKK